jgi:hypothetical protein
MRVSSAIRVGDRGLRERTEGTPRRRDRQVDIRRRAAATWPITSSE